MIKKAIIADRKILIILFFYTFLLLFFCSKMSPLYPFNEWSDINLYFNIGKGIFHGRVPYIDSFDHKGPLIFFIYGFGYLISNTSFFGMYLIESLGWVCMVFAAYLTARMYLDKVYSYLVATLFPSFMLFHTFEGGSAEEFIAIAQSVSLCLFIMYFRKKDIVLHKPVYMVVHGALFAVTLLIKINLVVFWIFPLLAIFIWLLQNKEYKNVLQNIGAFLIGSMLVCLPVIIYLAANKALVEAWDIYIVLNKNYASVGSLGEIIERLFFRFYQRLRFQPFEFIIILLGAVYFPIRYIENKMGRLSIILSFFSLYVIIFISSQYFIYYAVPCFIYTSMGCIVICKYLKIPSTKSTYILISIAALLFGIKQQNLFKMQISELIKREKPQALVYQFSDKIMQEENPTLLNLGLDLGNAVFTKTGIIPTFRYFISPNLPYYIYPQMRDEQTKYIENREPQFIILTDFSFNSSYFLSLPALVDNYTVIDTYIEAEYKTYYLYKRND